MDLLLSLLQVLLFSVKLLWSTTLPHFLLFFQCIFFLCSVFICVYAFCLSTFLFAFWFYWFYYLLRYSTIFNQFYKFIYQTFLLLLILFAFNLFYSFKYFWFTVSTNFLYLLLFHYSIVSTIPGIALISCCFNYALS